MQDDPMLETNKKFYDIINSEDWEDELEELIILDDDMDDFTPPVMQYWLQSPIPNVFIRVDFTVEKDEENQQKEYLNFLNNLREFLNRKEDEGW
jgi:hypothetical protein|tara:strand:+ start:375 stop:656 length:282 start_codon:yes stop_codon:yes gene_type:complete